MFTQEDKNKLINELNNQLKNNTFYISSYSKKVNTTEKSKNTSSLYRPFLSADSNKLDKPVYNYSNSVSIPVHGIAFEPSKMVNKVEKNVFFGNQELNMCDIIKNTEESDILNFKAIPKEMALAKISKNTNFWTKDIDIFKTIKSIFKK